MEKDLFEGMRLVAIGGDRPKVSALAMTVKKDRKTVIPGGEILKAWGGMVF